VHGILLLDQRLAERGEAATRGARHCIWTAVLRLLEKDTFAIRKFAHGFASRPSARSPSCRFAFDAF